GDPPPDLPVNRGKGLGPRIATQTFCRFDHHTTQLAATDQADSSHREWKTILHYNLLKWLFI
ncbi:MAG: hypothetical protein KZQ86_13075, partial [Candidatus Thiodiazotropha sp. (ex Lucinoma kastoroae)]|nr:hypothetical protein [Candidatus Thiodiazotropha sp. (ex Lucinoma kastoroae)]